jgi:hypothetical protein
MRGGQDDVRGGRFVFAPNGSPRTTRRTFPAETCMNLGAAWWRVPTGGVSVPSLLSPAAVVEGGTAKRRGA